MSRRGVPTGRNSVRFERHSRRDRIGSRLDVTITAMTYLRASEITVLTKATLLRALLSLADEVSS